MSLTRPSQLFNEYADPANFYDICLLIYHAANYHNSSIVERTWTDLIEALDNEALEQQAAWEASQASGTPPASETDAAPPQRYVVVATTLTELAHRVALDSHVFPVGFLLGEVCKYAYRAEQDGRVGADPNWPIELFLRSLGVPADTVLRTLEDLWEQQILPFRGSARVRVVEWIAHAADVWVRDIARRGGVGVGASALLPAVGGAASVLGAGAAGIGGAAARPLHALRELLVRCMESLASETYNPGGAKVDDIRRTLRETIRVLDALMQPGRFA